MTSEVEEGPRLITAGYGQHGSQWVRYKTFLRDIHVYTYVRYSLAHETEVTSFFSCGLCLLCALEMTDNQIHMRSEILSKRNVSEGLAA